MISLRKLIAKEKKDKGIKNSEGTDPMTFECYKVFSTLLIGEGIWFTIKWNLISKNEATKAISFDHMQWENDILKVFFKTQGRPR